MTKFDESAGGGIRPSRRQFLALGAGAFVVAALPRALRPPRGIVRRQFPAMGTIGEIAVVARDRRWAHGAIDAAVAELARVEAAMSYFRRDSDVGRVNRAAVGVPVAVDGATTYVVAAGLAWAEASDGAFDPALARASALWDVSHRTAPPPPEAVGRWAGRGLYRYLEPALAGGSPAIVRRDTDVSVDLGGIAKGHGVDRAVAALRDWGVGHALVNVGGDLYALGESPERVPWEVGIRSPADPDALAATLRVSDRAVATSGDYERYFVHGGRRYHHLLDPRTGAPRESRIHGVTVLADTCMAADAAATAAFGLEREAAQALVARAAPGAEVVHA